MTWHMAVGDDPLVAPAPISLHFIWYFHTESFFFLSLSVIYSSTYTNKHHSNPTRNIKPFQTILPFKFYSKALLSKTYKTATY